MRSILNLRISSMYTTSNSIRRNYISSYDVRKKFNKYFEENNHQFVSSIPVIAYTDKSLHFVNAGMNQFKSIFLGKHRTHLKCVFNTQKCIRVGGKHNDLDEVGRDSYHHTFFEMLGNWSFNDYFKKESCEMAWELLTEVYSIPAEKLYVTYFGGDSAQNLKPDLETKNLWLQIGVPESRILPFGMKDNFWEMGPNGPCGPSTEIHYDHTGTQNNSDLVNTGTDRLIELWNLVFIQHNRLENGTLEPLQGHFVDTGMGLERLVACLNGELSNYNTDLFTPIFDKLSQLSEKPSYSGCFDGKSVELDTAYRILADHSRMITVSLCDGMLPINNDMLRKLIKRSLNLGSKHFQLDAKNEWLFELVQTVSDILGPVYPEMKMNLLVAKSLLLHETELFLSNDLNHEWLTLLEQNPELNVLSNLKSETIHNLCNALPHIKKARELTNEEIDNICTTYELRRSMVSEILRAFNKDLDASKSSQESNVGSIAAEPTKIEAFNYYYDDVSQKYKVPSIQARVVGLWNNPEPCIVLDKTNFYAQAGGQAGDVGLIKSNEGSFKVKKTSQVGQHVYHFGDMSGSLAVGDDVMVNVHGRHGQIVAHSAHHLFMAALKTQGYTYQKNSQVNSNYFSLEVFSCQPLESRNILAAEEIVQAWIKKGTDISRQLMWFNDAIKAKDLTVLNHAKYPDHVYVLDTRFNDVVSRETCCGTHVLNTSHIGSFCVTDVVQCGNGITSIRAVTGSDACAMSKRGCDILNELKEWSDKISKALANNERVRGFDGPLKKWIRKYSNLILPYGVMIEANEESSKLRKQLEDVLYPGSTWKKVETRLLEIANPEDSFIGFVDVDFRGTQEELMMIVAAFPEIYPVAVAVKGWGRVRGAFIVPETKSVEELLSRLSGKISAGHGAVVGENRGHFIVSGVKRDKIEYYVDIILETSREYLL